MCSSQPLCSLITLIKERRDAGTGYAYRRGVWAFVLSLVGHAQTAQREADPLKYFFQCVGVFSRAQQTPVQLLQNQVLTLNPTQRRQGHVFFDFKRSELPTRSCKRRCDVCRYNKVCHDTTSNKLNSQVCERHGAISN
uniref:Uncharacterized protein n=1 Tax=Fundulus heteroclitus TaxID=8078 RepID=A0A3Q2R2B2_FUNHE